MSPPISFPQTMNSPSDRFIELATRPLCDNSELKLAAEDDLRKRLDANHAEAGEIDEAAQRLQEASSRRITRLLRPALYVAALVISLGVLLPLITELWLFSRTTLAMTQLTGPSADPVADHLADKLGPEKMLLLFGDPEAGGLTDRWKRLWNSQPDNPAYLSKHAMEYLRHRKDLPPEVRQAVDRIDPDNGWYEAIQAGLVADGAVKRKSQSTLERKNLVTPKWEIQDPEKLNRSLLLLSQAMEKPAFTNHDAEMLKLQIPLLPVPDDYLSQMVPVTYLASRTESSIHLGRIASAMAAAAQECVKQPDADKLRRLFQDWEKLAERQTRDGTSMVDLLVAQAIYQTPALNFRDAAQSLGLEQEAARFSRIAADQQQEREQRESKRGKPDTEDMLLQQHGSIHASMSIPVLLSRVNHPPPLSANDLEPGRHAEHAFFTRAAFSAAILVLGFCAGLAALHRMIQPQLHRQLSNSLLGLLQRSDWMWIIGVGILGPMVWYVFFVYLTPLSSRAWSFRSNGFLQFGSQLIGLMLLILTLSIMTTAAIIARRGRFLGLAPKRTRFGWLAVISAALAIPMSGSTMPLAATILRQTPIVSWAMWLSGVLLALPLLWLLVAFGKSILGDRSDGLRRSITARVLLPAWICGAVIMALSALLLHAEERHWVRRDTLQRILPDQPGLSNYEWRVTQQVRKELLEKMEQFR